MKQITPPPLPAEAVAAVPVASESVQSVVAESTVLERCRELAAGLQLSEEAIAGITALADTLGITRIDAASLATLAHAVSHDEDVSNAETQGYLRGRNEKIEATQHFDTQPDEAPRPAQFPTYNRRSIWE